LILHVLGALLNVPKPLFTVVVELVGVPDLALLVFTLISAEFLPANVTVFVELVLSALFPFALPFR